MYECVYKLVSVHIVSVLVHILCMHGLSTITHSKVLRGAPLRTYVL